MEEVELVAVSKGADYLEVHPTTLAAHRAAGWAPCIKREVAAEVDSKPSHGLNVADLKAALAAKNIAIPDGVTLKADLAKLLDEAPAS